ASLSRDVPAALRTDQCWPGGSCQPPGQLPGPSGGRPGRPGPAVSDHHPEDPVFVVTEKKRLPEHDVGEWKSDVREVGLEAEADTVSHAHDVERRADPDLIFVPGAVSAHDEVAELNKRFPLLGGEVREQQLARPRVAPLPSAKKLAQAARQMLEEKVEGRV